MSKLFRILPQDLPLVFRSGLIVWRYGLRFQSTRKPFRLKANPPGPVPYPIPGGSSSGSAPEPVLPAANAAAYILSSKNGR